jgi:NifU-like protein involved in Fe-S cluster formation
VAVTADASTDPTTEPALAAGDLTLTGEAGGPHQETWVRFHLTVANGIVKAARFKAYGCPHTLLVADWLTRRLPGRARAEGPSGTPAEWAEELQVPVEKLGRLLVVEDALRACFSRWLDHCA